jgi:hypothetical protein
MDRIIKLVKDSVDGGDEMKRINLRLLFNKFNYAPNPRVHPVGTKAGVNYAQTNSIKSASSRPAQQRHASPFGSASRANANR